MQTQTLNQIKRQIISLDETEKQNLAEFLAEELKIKSQNRDFSPVADDEIRKRQLDWLKANREKYAGKYVALIGDKLGYYSV